MAIPKMSVAAMAAGLDQKHAREIAKSTGIPLSDVIARLDEAIQSAGPRESVADLVAALIGILELTKNEDRALDSPTDYAVEGRSVPVGGPSADPFDLANISVAGTSAEDLGVEKPILHVPVDKPGKQEFFRTHPDSEYRVDARVIKLDAERETYLVTRSVWPAIPGETKLVQLIPYLTRTGGLGLWPLSMPDDLKGTRDTNWGVTARKAAEIAETKWVRMQANMSRGCYDVVTSSKIPDPVWPNTSLPEILKIAFGDGRLITALDHPVIRQLNGD